MRRFFALILLLVGLASPVFAQINVWKPFGVVIANSGSVFPAQPNVIFESGCLVVGSSPCFKMWYTCNTSDTCYAESLDGTTSWTNYASNPVITGGAYVRLKEFGGLYYLYASTFNAVTPPPMTVWTATDGVTFTEVNSSALAISQAWESKFIGQLAATDPVAGTFYGYYTSFDTGAGGYVEGQASSIDLIHWTKNPSNPIITQNNPGNMDFHEVGSLFYGWTLIRDPNIPQSGTDPALPSDIGRYEASTAGSTTWTTLNTPTFYRTQLAEGVGLTTGQVADPSLLQVGTCTSTSNCSVYMYYSDSTNGTTNATSQISLAIAPNETFASLVELYEGVQNIPIPTSFGFALNLNTVASDTFVRANQNPIAGNWSTMFTGSGVSGLQILSDAATSSATGNASYSYWNAVSWSNDQWGSITIGVVPSASVSEGVLLRANTSGAQTGYLMFTSTNSGGSPSAFHIGKYNSGTFTAIASSANIYTIHLGDVITASAIQQELCIYQNGNLILCASDGTITSGAVGMLANTNGNALSNISITGWSGGGVQNPPSITASSQIGAFLISQNWRDLIPLQVAP